AGFLVLSLLAIAAVLVAVWRHASSRRAAKAANDFAALARRFESQGALLRLVTDTQPNAIFILDAEGRYRFANEETAKRAGIAETDLIGKKIEAVLGPAAAERCLRLNRAALEKGEAVGALERVEGQEAQVTVLQSAHIPLGATPDAPRSVLV